MTKGDMFCKTSVFKTPEVLMHFASSSQPCAYNAFPLRSKHVMLFRDETEIVIKKRKPKELNPLVLSRIPVLLLVININ